MKNLALAVSVALLVILGGFYVFAPTRGVGIPSFEPTFSTVTATQVSCSATNATTSVASASVGRASFLAANLSNDTIYLCRSASTCSATSGLPLFATSSGSGALFEQKDAYTGAYTCRAATATSTLNILYSQ